MHHTQGQQHQQGGQDVWFDNNLDAKPPGSSGQCNTLRCYSVKPVGDKTPVVTMDSGANVSVVGMRWIQAMGLVEKGMVRLEELSSERPRGECKLLGEWYRE